MQNIFFLKKLDMKYSFIVLTVAIAIAGCTKKDILYYKKYVKENKCQVVSINADQQNTDNFFLVKTLDQWGKLTHIKTQLRDVSGGTYIYDYDVSYLSNKAIFKGTTTATYWDLNPEENTDPMYNDPPAHFAGKEVVDNKDFEVLFDAKTRFATQVRYAGSQTPLVTIKYDRRNFIDSVNEFDVTTDQRGNILSIYLGGDPRQIEMFGYIGVTYGYNDQTGKRRRQFYEPASIFVHDKYSLLEVLDWGPFQPDKERTGFDVMWAYPPEEINMDVNVSTSFHDHIYDSQGNLISYTYEGDFERTYYPFATHAGIRQRQLEWTCMDKIK